jgi:choline dehydrogenase-like flavoprotein
MMSKKRIAIIGSGAGGSVIAAELASAGFSVTIFEEGEVAYKPKIKSSLLEPFFNFYRYGGVLPIFSKPLISFAEGRVFGGTTVINGGLLWRTPTWIIDEWIQSDSISTEMKSKFNRIFNLIEKNLNVQKVKLKSDNKDSLALINGAKKLDWRIVEAPRAVKNCQNHNRCSSVCSSGAKQSMAITYLEVAKLNGAKIEINSKILKLTYKGAHVIGLKGVKDKKKFYQEFDYFFVCGGAIQSPVLLRNSGIKNNIGNSLSLHLNLRFLCIFDRKINPKNATIFSHQIQEFDKEGILIMASNYQLPWVFASLESKNKYSLNFALKNSSNSALYTTQIRPKGIGFVRSLGAFGTFCKYNLLNEDYELIKKAIYKTVEVLFLSGASEVYLPIGNSNSVKNKKELTNLLANLNPKKLELLSVHAMSSAPMGSGVNAAVDFDGKVKSFNNLYLADASILPSNIGESPQGTIMFFAHHIAEKFISRLKRN